jgi:hypothetical protein
MRTYFSVIMYGYSLANIIFSFIFDYLMMTIIVCIGLDVDKFRSEMSGHIYAPLVNKSLKSGIDSGVGGTPTFFINGQRYEDSYDFDTLTSFIKKSLSR